MIENIPLAQKIIFELQEKNKGSFVIEPLYPGYGLTLGNALRRVLLSSLSSAAIKAVKIKGVNHEFSTLEWMKEDVVDLILNLKLVRIKLDEELIKQAEDLDQPIKLNLDVKGEKEVTAKDFDKMTGVEIVNPDQKIATLTDAAARLEMEVILGFGRGYSPTESRQNEEYEIGVIAIDAIYTPVLRVGYEIENVRVGQMTNWDRITLNIETDGTLTPQESFEKAVRILIEQFSGLISTENTESTESTKAQPEDNELTAAKDESEVVDGGSQEEVKEEKPKKRGRPKKN